MTDHRPTPQLHFKQYSEHDSPLFDTAERALFENAESMTPSIDQVADPIREAAGSPAAAFPDDLIFLGILRAESEVALGRGLEVEGVRSVVLPQRVPVLPPRPPVPIAYQSSEQPSPASHGPSHAPARAAPHARTPDRSCQSE